MGKHQFGSVPGAIALALVWLGGCGGIDLESPGVVEGRERSLERLQADADAQQEARAALGPPAVGSRARQILFGDLHVHTSYSWDGMLSTLPLIGGEGAHPPADACDFARYCADLDFFALTDHAENLTLDQWTLQKESIRQCNAVVGDPENPDLVAFTGFEWSQAGLTPDTHFGHRCVIFPETDEDALPPRPIGFANRKERYEHMAGLMGGARWLQPHEFLTYADLQTRFEDFAAVPDCPEDAGPEEDCREIAPRPGDLHAKLDELGLEALTIPHGTAWGAYTPASATIDKHLDPEQFDPERQPLIEIMSGHGNSEEFRRFRERLFDANGDPVCPEPTADYLPCCWQAGAIMRSRCGDLPEEECERRVQLARKRGAMSWTLPQRIFPDADPQEWLDCDQCRNCFKPSYGYRPRESVQYAMALSRDDPGAPDGRPRRFRYGFVASSDNHTARPGTGYKQIERTMMTDMVGQPGAFLRTVMGFARRMDDPQMPADPEAEAVGVTNADIRTGSFLYPGGLAAVHASGRSRGAIWEALRRREVYGTSGPRILLWFDLLWRGQRHPMGSEVALGASPLFEVRAVGDFVQQPGCPSRSTAGLSADRLARLCHDECRNPGDERHPIAAIEVIRIRPQISPEEEIQLLVEDPWRRFECKPDPKGCIVHFADPQFLSSGRDALYYVRALQQPTWAINGSPLETRFDAAGRPVSTRPCAGPGTEDGCPSPVHERAWSSPIFVDQL